MKHLIIIMITIPFLSFGQYSNVDWAFPFHSNGSDFGEAMTIDSKGNVYIAGYFSDTIDFDPGPDTALHIPVGTGDIFIAKYSKDGTYIWSKSMGSVYNDFVYDLVCDSNDDLYFAGGYSSGIDFDPDTGTAILSGFGPYVCKFDEDGAFQWVTPYSSSTLNHISSIYLDDNQFLYVTGYSNFVSKLNLNGNVMWTNVFDTSFASEGKDITIDPFHQILITGYFIDSLILDGGANPVKLYAPGGDYDIFVAKMDTTGNVFWGKSIGGSGKDEAVALDCDSAGSMYITGSYHQSVDFDPGSAVFTLASKGNFMDMFLLKLDITGSFVWAKDVGHRGTNFGINIKNTSNGLYFSGFLADTVIYKDKGIIGRLDGSGNISWVQSFIGAALINDMEFDNGQVYVMGDFYNRIDFDTGTDTLYFNDGNIMGDVFVLKFVENTINAVEKNIVRSSIKLYPNPSNGKVFVDLQDHQGAVINIYSVNGQFILSSQLNSGTQVVELPSEKGVYMVELILNNGHRSVGRVIKY